MCQLFISADDSLWSSKTKSLRIQGVVTSIRLEVFFWDILEELSFRDQMTVNQLITKLYLESLDADHDIGNFTSFFKSLLFSLFIFNSRWRSFSRNKITFRKSRCKKI
ncbi:ribbon-helix-helix domain-containing protein [Psychrobacter sp. JCM 18901]|uniref:ribbon-helix-helix domain-containing protein n=1 Tax=Psychrobacter sp. JCM 18901 TaxID=1298609 RepID=UPI0021C3C1D3|nr:ribbon-helix-helix domain-containing protein [Psychrobacter sp. JCM 18901]